jgi:hypothetical protein
LHHVQHHLRCLPGHEAFDVRRPALQRRSPLGQQLAFVVVTPPRSPLAWLTAISITSGLMPRSAGPVTKVRRKSCSRHGAGVPMAASSLFLIIDQPPTGDLPLIVNT